jgi:uncharacterized damage-inducible protein DinB
MKRSIFISACIFISVTGFPQTITTAERQKSADLLVKSLGKLKGITSSLNDSQLNFKPAEGRWSIKNNVDHLVNVEEIVWTILNRILKEPGDGQKSDISDDEFILKLSTREQNFKAPEILKPDYNKYASFKEALQSFEDKRNRTIEFVKTTRENLRGHFSKNPVFGNLDAYQWTLHVSAHAYRHIEQIEEIMRDSKFPVSSVAHLYTPEDKKKTIDLLHASIEKLKAVTTDLSENQLKFKPAEDRWSIMSNVIHLVNVENRIYDIIITSLKTPGDGQNSTVKDEDFYKRMVTRNTNFKATGELLPDESKYANFTEVLKAFIQTRTRTLDFLKTTEENLRDHFSKMGASINLDAVQWAQYAASHCYRHIEQIEEIKGHNGFPKK